jgi:DNA uptake protein ComE-like DNA-binding protein
VYGRRVVVRVLAIGDGLPEPIPQAASLDANYASAASMAKLEFMDEATAEAVVAARKASSGGRFQELAALHEIIGRAHQDDEMPSGPVDLSLYAHAPMRAPHQTVVQPWSDDIGASVVDTIGVEGVALLAKLPEGEPETFTARVAAASPTPELWGIIVQHTVGSDEGFLTGQVDLASASASTLATLPGIDAEQALHLVAIRESLPNEHLATLSWPWTEGGLERSLEAELLPLLTVGSWTWRCTLACGEVLELDEAEVLLDPVWVDVVFDVSGEVPRVAMLRRLLGPPGSLDGLVLPQQSEEDEALDTEPLPDDVELLPLDGADGDASTEPLPIEDWRDDEALFGEDSLELLQEPAAETSPASKASGVRVGRWQ